MFEERTIWLHCKIFLLYFFDTCFWSVIILAVLYKMVLNWTIFECRVVSECDMFWSECHMFCSECHVFCSECHVFCLLFVNRIIKAYTDETIFVTSGSLENKGYCWRNACSCCFYFTRKWLLYCFSLYIVSSKFPIKCKW